MRASDSRNPSTDVVNPGSVKPWTLYTPGQRRLLLLTLFLVGTSSYVDRHILSVLLEPIKQEFGASDTQLGLLTGLAFALFYVTLGLPVARWADYGNRKLIVALSLFVWSVMTMLSGLAASFWHLALARIGVGAGEAGIIPTSQSLVADYFPPGGRGRAIGIFMLCAMAGNVLGLVAGGWIAQEYGWRSAFVVVGAPGLLLLLLVFFTVSEPRLRLPAAEGAAREPLGDTLRALGSKPSYRSIVAAMILYWMMAYGALIFTPSFLVRVHGLDVAQAGAVYGTVAGIGAVIGTFLGGALIDRMAKQDIAWLARLPGIILMFQMPIYQAAYLMPNVTLSAAFLLIGGIGLTAAIPGLFASLQLVCGARRRAMAVAIAFFFANAIGLVLGPLVSGMISDALAARIGAGEGLRWALVIIMSTFLPAGYFLVRAGRHLEADTEEGPGD